MSDPWTEHRAVTAIYAEASAQYEAAAMSGDDDKLRAADEALNEADGLYGESLAKVVEADKRARARRNELPSFETILAHPWTQPPEDSPRIVDVVYRDVLPQTVALPFIPGARRDRP